MRYKALQAILLSCFLLARAEADSRFVVRVDGGVQTLRTVCVLLGCNVKYGLEDPAGQVFLVTTPDLLDASSFLSLLRVQSKITNAELDVLGGVRDDPGYSAPPALGDRNPVDHFGATVWRGYVGQPALQIIGLDSSRAAFNLKGAAIVAVIDTGVDPRHPALSYRLLPGHDFTRDTSNADSEMADVNQSTAGVLDDARPTFVNQRTVAVLDQSTAGVLDGSQYSAFGHGTMVTGIIHVVAPGATILPLKAFKADGTGYLSNAIRAIYRAVKQNARVIHMSFSFSAYSDELAKAIDAASRNGVISVASAGNDGIETIVYPAGLQQVIGVASTTDTDQRSSFSNFGDQLVWVAAPGEAIVSTFPFGTYAAAWGTSFSAPLVSGTAALMLELCPACGQAEVADALASAKPLGPGLGKGRLDLFQALTALRMKLGIN